MTYIQKTRNKTVIFVTSVKEIRFSFLYIIFAPDIKYSFQAQNTSQAQSAVEFAVMFLVFLTFP